MTEFGSRNPADQAVASLYLQILLLKLSGCQSTGYEAAAGENPSLESACRYICDYYNTDIRLDELAASVGYSPDRFRHIFKERFGISPKQLILFNRFKAAKQLLAGDEKIENIAKTCGFGSSSQFNMMFKKTQKMTPGQYRIKIAAQKKQALEK
jgi:AraC family transcriptional activator of pobA